MLLLNASRWRYLAMISIAWLALFTVTRVVLLCASFSAADVSVWQLLLMFVQGLVYDLGFLSFASLPLGLYLTFCPQWLWSNSWHQLLLRMMFAISLFVMLFTAVSEWLFWDEFSVRFNFIAVDYLVYSKEVIDNILESYPVYPLLAGLALLAVVLTVMLKKPLHKALRVPESKVLSRLPGLAVLIALAGLSGLLLSQDFPRGSDGNSYQRELAANGPYQFFAAFRNNELDYPSFYATLDEQQVGALLRAEVEESHARFVSDNPLDIRREITYQGAPRHLNVVLVTIESLSAKYLGSFGDERGLTPNLDKLRRESLAFTNLYATGTRTDRGLEAITLSVPPTPGRSLVKRIGRESGFASLGQQLNAQGYDSVFVYGGRGYFDNMNAFFSGNGYRIVDQSSVPDSEMSFTNAWGMADEDLYAQTLKIADADHAQGKPFFLQLMTTSNHRPYSYPDGRIDIASGEGREGAVKYTDYAIGEFLRQAQQKPWFAETIFVFVADHTAGSAGKEDLPVSNYHIPMFIYAPHYLQPNEIDTLVSQIDIAPTLLGLLNQSYISTFFGRDILRPEAALRGRALLGNYQHLGLFDGGDLAILSPRKTVRRHDDALGVSYERRTNKSNELVQRDIAYYQGASYDIAQGLLKWQGTAVVKQPILARLQGQQ
ncbi:LTA synthase family protein [Denitrificimonas caeni]|uniref:LTA synthase family protein n=1 Tax=Denitrificimonas caeni TaxID=521720 RepID=UPI0019629C87|nr:LTA synthase family protein [Denitrificimonas caeni]